MRKSLLIVAIVMLLVMTFPLVFLWGYGNVHPLPDESLESQLHLLVEKHVVYNDAYEIMKINDVEEFASGLNKVYTAAPTDLILLAIFNVYNEQLKDNLIMQETACYINKQYSQDKLFLFVKRLEKGLGMVITADSIDQLIPQCNTTPLLR